MFSLWGRSHGKVWGQIWMHFARCQVHSWKNDNDMATWTLYPTLLGKFLLHGDIVANRRKSIWPICSTDTKLLGRLGDNLLSIIIFLRHFKVIKKLSKIISAQKVESNHCASRHLQVWSLHPGPPRIIWTILNSLTYFLYNLGSNDSVFEKIYFPGFI